VNCGLRIEDRVAAGRSASNLPPRTRPGQPCETNPIWPVAGDPEGEMCETKPISVGQGPQGPNAPNKPNFRRSRCPITPAFHYSSIPARCQPCETNPIPAAPGPWSIRTNKANCPCRQAGCGWWPLVQTKPIWHLVFGSGRAQAGLGPPAGGDCAKQTQFRLRRAGRTGWSQARGFSGSGGAGRRIYFGALQEWWAQPTLPGE